MACALDGNSLNFRRVKRNLDIQFEACNDYDIKGELLVVDYCNNHNLGRHFEVYLLE